MRTLTIKKGSGSQWTQGWHEIEISDAKYGDYNGTKYIDVWFTGYPESFNLRVYSKQGKDGEEFAVGRLFRFANAGIKSVSKSNDGESIVQIDDSPETLKGKKVNVFFYKDGDYNSVLANVAPIEFTNELESFGEEDIKYWKSQAEKYYNNYIKNSSNGITEDIRVVNSNDASTNDIPW